MDREAGLCECLYFLEPQVLSPYHNQSWNCHEIEIKICRHKERERDASSTSIRLSAPTFWYLVVRERERGRDIHTSILHNPHFDFAKDMKFLTPKSYTI